MSPEEELNELVERALKYSDGTKPVVVALFYDENEHGEYDTDADKSVEEHLTEDFLHWDLHDCLESGRPIDEVYGEDMILYGYYNRLSQTIHWL